MSYRPSAAVSGPTYGIGFKVVATVLVAMLAIGFARLFLRAPELQLGTGPAFLLACAAVAIGVSYFGFLQSRITINEEGITRTGIRPRHVPWSEIRSATTVVLPALGPLFPVRLVVRTGSGLQAFHGGDQPLCEEYRRIAQAYRSVP